MSAELRVSETVRRIVADVLALEAAEVTLAARFFSDLNGESLDLLEASFAIEKHLGVRVDFNHLLTNDSLQVDTGGAFTTSALEWLQCNYPFLQIERLNPPITPELLKNELTISMIVAFTEAALVEKTQAAQKVSPA